MAERVDEEHDHRVDDGRGDGEPGKGADLRQRVGGRGDPAADDHEEDIGKDERAEEDDRKAEPPADQPVGGDAHHPEHRGDGRDAQDGVFGVVQTMPFLKAVISSGETFTATSAGLPPPLA